MVFRGLHNDHDGRFAHRRFLEFRVPPGGHPHRRDPAFFYGAHGEETKVAIGIVSVLAVAVLSYLQFAGSGDVPRDNEAEIERAYGLSAEDMKTRMHAVDEGPDVFTIMESPGGGTGRYLFDTGSGLQRIIITTEPKDSKGDLHMTMYNEDGSPIRPAPSGERARTVGNGHIVSWSPQPDGDDGGDGAVPGGDRVDDGHHRVNTAAPSDVI